MSCSNPKKAFEVGKTLKGKADLLVTPYEVNHIELKNGKWQKVFTNTISPYADKVVSSFIELPCGKCLGCRLDHARMWQDRIVLELLDHNENCFITLTYNDEHLPSSKKNIVDSKTGEVSEVRNGNYNSLDIRDLQLFFKRLRKKTGKKIRYFACGEYGSESKRPHYHIICFGYKPEDLEKLGSSELGDILYTSKILESCWTDKNGNVKGFITIGEATQESAGYVARYTTKKLADNDNNFYSTYGIDKEFITMSRKPGIARNYYERHKDNDLYRYEHIVIPTDKGPRIFKPCRYFDKLYEVDNPEHLKEIKEKNKIFMEDKKQLKLKGTDLSYLELLKQENEVLENKTKILKNRRKV